MFPELKKKVCSFLVGEEGKVSKNSLLGLGVFLGTSVLVGSLSVKDAHAQLCACLCDSGACAACGGAACTACSDACTYGYACVPGACSPPATPPPATPPPGGACSPPPGGACSPPPGGACSPPPGGACSPPPAHSSHSSYPTHVNDLISVDYSGGVASATHNHHSSHSSS